MPQVKLLLADVDKWEKELRLDDKLSKTKRKYKTSDRELITKNILKHKNKIENYHHLFTFSENDLVTTIAKNKVGRVIGNCGHKSPFFLWIQWGKFQPLISSHSSVLLKVNLLETQWRWDGNRFYREFDDITCNDLDFLYGKITEGKIRESVWCKSQYNLLSQQMFAIGDEIIHQNKYYSINAIATDENDLVRLNCSHKKLNYSLYPHEVLVKYTVF